MALEDWFHFEPQHCGMTSRIPTVSLLSFVTLFYSTLLIVLKTNTHYPSGVLFFGNTKTVYCMEACWDDGHEQIRDCGKSVKKARVERGEKEASDM